MEINPEAREELDRILALSPAELTESDAAFLHARRPYLSEEQRITFGVTDDAPASEDSAPTEATETSEEDAATPAKAAKAPKAAK